MQLSPTNQMAKMDAIMSEAFANAIRYVEQMKKQGIPDIDIQLRFPAFRQGDFTVNRVYSFNPILVGMYSAGNPMVKFDKPTLTKIFNLAKCRSLKPDLSGLDVFLRSKDNVAVAWLRENFFGALEAELFETVGQEIYGLTSKANSVNVTFTIEESGNTCSHGHSKAHMREWRELGNAAGARQRQIYISGSRHTITAL